MGIVMIGIYGTLAVVLSLALYWAYVQGAGVAEGMSIPRKAGGCSGVIAVAFVIGIIGAMVTENFLAGAGVFCGVLIYWGLMWFSFDVVS